MRKILYLIPARGGSKGIPGKNIKSLAGKPLIHYTIDAARVVADDSDICVSTDSPEIKESVENYGLPLHFMRPEELATDIATSESVIKHALDFFNSKGIYYDIVVLLQPTSPLRTGKHIREALALINDNTQMIVSVKKTDANPYYVLFEENEKGELRKVKESNFTARQACPEVYELNGAIYIVSVQALYKYSLAGLSKTKYLMDKRSSVDIDDQFDWELSEFLIARK